MIMDTTEKYIKMSDNKDIQSLWVPADGDFYVYFIVDHDPQIFIRSARHGVDPVDSSHWIWLPRQDQCQDILTPNMTLGYMVCGLDAFFDPERYCADGVCDVCKWHGIRRRTIYDTMEQWWLAFMMFEKFSKEWNGLKWVKMDVNK